MDISVEKIEESLKVIRDVCKSHSCTKCPLRKGETTCYVMNKCPENYEFRSEGDDNRIFVVEE